MSIHQIYISTAFNQQFRYPIVFDTITGIFLKYKIQTYKWIRASVNSKIHNTKLGLPQFQTQPRSLLANCNGVNLFNQSVLLTSAPCFNSILTIASSPRNWKTWKKEHLQLNPISRFNMNFTIFSCAHQQRVIMIIYTVYRHRRERVFNTSNIS